MNRSWSDPLDPDSDPPSVQRGGLGSQLSDKLSDTDPIHGHLHRYCYCQRDSFQTRIEPLLATDLALYRVKFNEALDRGRTRRAVGRRPCGSESLHRCAPLMAFESLSLKVKGGLLVFQTLLNLSYLL